MPVSQPAPNEVGEFLSSRRARISPEQAGVQRWGGRRRVAGLRREEVAQLAGVSTDYYARLERGNLQGVSDGVLDSLARALRLDDAERGHLFDLAAAANSSSRTRRPRRAREDRADMGVRTGILRVVESMVDAPAFVMNRHRDVVAANALGRALYSELYDEAARPVNTARFTFLSPAARTFFLDWSRTADDTVANLRTDAGAHPFDTRLRSLIGELVTRSDEFRLRWASHDVRYHHSGVKGFRHPVVGELRLGFEVLRLPAEDDLLIVAYHAEPGSPEADALTLLASWVADRPSDPAAVTGSGQPRTDRSSHPERRDP